MGITFYAATTLTSTLTFAIFYYLFAVIQKPKIHSGNKKMKQFLHNHVKTSESTYWPSPLYWNGLLQSILGLTKRISAKVRLPYQREILTLSDGGEVALDFLESEATTNGNKLTVVFLPGLTSSSQTSYVKTMTMAITKAGANVIVFNNRGIGGVPLKTPRTYCAATLTDFIDVISYLKKKCPNEKFLAIGTSFGTITLCRYFTKHPKEAQEVFIGALLVSSVFDLEGGARGIETPIEKYFLNNAICQDLVYRFKRFEPILGNEPWYNLEKLKKCKTVRDFDREFTSKQFGFKSDLEYYEEASSTKDLHKLTLPVYSLSAADDPMQLEKYLPIKQAEEETSKLLIIKTSHGGHLGFLEGIRAKPFHFLEKLTLDFVQAVLHNRDEFIASV